MAPLTQTKYKKSYFQKDFLNILNLDINEPYYITYILNRIKMLSEKRRYNRIELPKNIANTLDLSENFYYNDYYLIKRIKFKIIIDNNDNNNKNIKSHDLIINDNGINIQKLIL